MPLKALRGLSTHTVVSFSEHQGLFSQIFRTELVASPLVFFLFLLANQSHISDGKDGGCFSGLRIYLLVMWPIEYLQ